MKAVSGIFLALALVGCTATPRTVSGTRPDGTVKSPDGSTKVVTRSDDGITKTTIKSKDGTTTVTEPDQTDLASAALGAKIKAALFANPITNSPGVAIDVAATMHQVVLKGQTPSKEEKDEAERITKRILKESNARQEFQNELKIVKAVVVDDGKSERKRGR